MQRATHLQRAGWELLRQHPHSRGRQQVYDDDGHVVGHALVTRHHLSQAAHGLVGQLVAHRLGGFAAYGRHRRKVR